MWPLAEWRTITNITFFKRAQRSEKGRTKIVEDVHTRICHLDAEIQGDDAWMEAGLELVSRS
jgi:hypothetical protein